MFDLSLVRDALVASAPSIEQVILPDGEGRQGVDTAVLLTSLVEPVVSDNINPLRLPLEPAYPSVVYKLIESTPRIFGGYPILIDESYLLAIGDDEYGTARTASDSIRDALLAYKQTDGAGTWTILDQADDYRKDLEIMETGLGVTATHLAQTDQSIPAAFVYPQGHEAIPDRKYGLVCTDEETRFSVLLVMRVPTGGVSEISATLTEVQAAVMAMTATGWSRPLWYGGDVVTIHNTLLLWQEDFGFSRHGEF